MSPIPIYGEITMRPRHQAGWIEERGTKRKYWYGQFYVYIRNETGIDERRHTGVMLGYKSQMTKSAAKEKLQKIIFERVGKEAKPDDAVTLEWFYRNRFAPMREANWSKPTKRGNESDMRLYVLPRLGAMPLRDINLFQLQTHINKMADKGFSRAVVARVRTILWSIFDVAVDLEYLPKNLMAKVDMPKCKPTAKPVLPKDDIVRLFTAITDTRDRLILMLGVFAGPRASEVFGLQWQCYKGDHLEIRNTAWQGDLMEWNVKRHSSFRRIWLGAHVQKMFEQWKATAPDTSDSALIFRGRGGRPMWPGVWLQKHVQRIAKSLGIQVPVTFQTLRRSCATRNQKHGSLKDVQAHLGHASIETTGNVYMQEISETVQRMVDLDEMDVLGGVQ
jgi:integrase